MNIAWTPLGMTPSALRRGPILLTRPICEGFVCGILALSGLVRDCQGSLVVSIDDCRMVVARPMSTLGFVQMNPPRSLLRRKPRFFIEQNPTSVCPKFSCLTSSIDMVWLSSNVSYLMIALQIAGHPGGWHSEHFGGSFSCFFCATTEIIEFPRVL